MSNSNQGAPNTVLNNQPLVSDPVVITDKNISNPSSTRATPDIETPSNNNSQNQLDEFKTDSVDSFTIEEQDWENTYLYHPNLSPLQKIKYFSMSFYSKYIKPNIGLSLLLLSQFLNSIMVTTCKLLVTDKNFNTPIHPAQILKLLLLRGLVGFFGVFGMYFSLQYLSLSDAVALTFLVPMVTAFLAFVLLHEKYSILEAICSVFSLAGVVLIAKPTFISSSSSEKRILATIVGLIGVCGASSVYIVLRKIGMNAHPLLSVSYFALTCCIVTFLAILVIPSLTFVLPTNAYQWTLFFIIGFSGFFMQFSLTAGVQRVKAARASLMAYSGMIFAVVWDLTIWHHFPGILSFLGITLIIGNAIIILKFKPQQEEITDKQGDDIERNGKYNRVDDSITMQDFIITDDEEEENVRGRP
ncbi:EamA-like transporter family protein [Candida albicans]|uniref:EamA-like transporter family protein n=1 Tax=Candida albicans TaxID=5476 RepID=A0A8H6BSD8_CANAX|nr:EamA-like transporter family protein [Candida albicans]